MSNISFRTSSQPRITFTKESSVLKLSSAADLQNGFEISPIACRILMR